MQNGENIRIWDDLHFKAWPGQIIAITGCNGTGKTTLAKIIAGLEKPSSGNILFFGRKVRAGRLRKRCWYSSNDTGTQFFTNSVVEELLLGLPETEEVFEKAREILKLFDLYGYKDAHPAVLSGGQKQKAFYRLRAFVRQRYPSVRRAYVWPEGGNMRKIASAFCKAAARRKDSSGYYP